MNIAILGAIDEPTWLEDIQTKLMATNKFQLVDIVDVIESTPTLSTLLNYDSLLVFNDLSYLDNVELGNIIADYIDTGRGVVASVFETGSNGENLSLQGRWYDEGYYVIDSNGQDDFTQLYLGTVLLPNHPIMVGVNTFDGGSASYHGIGSLSLYTTVIANWTNGLTLIAEKSNKNNGDPISGKCVALNFYPPSSDVRFDFWNPATDGAIIMANALEYAGGVVLNYTVKLTPNEVNVDTEGSLDTSIVNGVSKQRTINCILVQNNNSQKFIVNAKDGSTFDNRIQNLGNIEGIVELTTTTTTPAPTTTTTTTPAPTTTTTTPAPTTTTTTTTTPAPTTTTTTTPAP
jgi:hypothetical protein